MALHKIDLGLDLPITGQPRQVIEQGPDVTRVAVVASDYVGMKPRMQVLEGDEVLRGQPLFEDRKNPGVVFTAPAAGTVAAGTSATARACRAATDGTSHSARSVMCW